MIPLIPQLHTLQSIVNTNPNSEDDTVVVDLEEMVASRLEISRG